PEEKIEGYETKLYNVFGKRLAERVQWVLSTPSGGVSPYPGAPAFQVLDLYYGSMEIVLAALDLEKYATLVGIAMPAILAVVEASVPWVLRGVLDLENDISFAVELCQMAER